jgi:DNA-binding SARP family transcriptional activator
MEFNVLGPVEARHCGVLCTPTATKVRWTLAFLVLQANRVVDRDALVDELWGDDPPRSAVTTVQTYIYHLRRTFAAVRPASRILTRPPGYVLESPSGTVDSHEFERLVEQGRQRLKQGDPAPAARILRDALDLWRGPALADIPIGRVLRAHVTHLEELRIKALGLRITADRLLGRADELLPELRSLIITHPLNERFHGELMRALTSSGRRGEAVQAYHALRQVLDEELGLEPSLPLQRLHEDLLVPSRR